VTPSKTVKSRRTLKLPRLCVEAFRKPWEHAGLTDGAAHWSGTDRLVFCTKNGTALSAGNVRRDFRKILKDAGLVDVEWTPREMHHSFASLLSDSGVPIEHISRLVGHANTVVTKTVYRL
jgi:site-specific recombinase XerD